MIASVPCRIHIIVFFYSSLISALGQTIEHHFPSRSRNLSVPEDFLIKLQTVQNTSQFLNSWIDQSAVQRAYLTDGDEEETTVEIAHPAGCIPEMQIVEFEHPSDPSLVIWPPCTRVRRCGGCCLSKLLHCVPTKTSMVTVKVIKTRYPHPGAEMLELEAYENIRLEVHDQCACKCRQEEQDCSPKQRYQPGQCRCVCLNQHEASRCRQPDQYWENKECSCKCRLLTDCSTGSVFNNTTCKCEAVNNSTPSLETIPRPSPILSAILRSESGESDHYKTRFPGLDPDVHVGPFAMAQYREERTMMVDNVTSLWSEG